MILSFFVPHQLVSVPADFLQQCAVIVVAFGYVLGGANAFRVNLDAICAPPARLAVQGRARGRAARHAGLRPDRGPRELPGPGTVSMWIYDHLYVAHERHDVRAAGVLHRLGGVPRVPHPHARGGTARGRGADRDARACAGRATRSRASSSTTMGSRTRCGLQISDLQQWIMDVPQNAAKRAVLIGRRHGRDGDRPARHPRHRALVPGRGGLT